MKVLHHLVYEYQKGLRDLCLFTCPNDLQEKIEKSLKSQDIEYSIYTIGEDKINIFFGMPECLEIVKGFSTKDLSRLSHEEDFILGMMLGYAKAQQYVRYLKRKLVLV